MKAKTKAVPKKSAVVALALAWDGSRCSMRSLPGKARVFLGAGSKKIPEMAELSRLLAEGKISEMRICWVPRLQGGRDVLCAPFVPPEGARIRFQVVKQKRFGDVLGMVLRRGRS